MNKYRIAIKITLLEERCNDVWFDLSQRKLKGGMVYFYKVKDLHTGEWLFKICVDEEIGRFIVKALKCPAGRFMSQLEGNAMLFQKSIIDGLLYDIVSLSQIDSEGKVRRRVIGNFEDVPNTIRDCFQVVEYEKATGKKIVGSHVVSLNKFGDTKEMIALFLMERAWPLIPLSQDISVKIPDVINVIKELERADVDLIHNVLAERYNIQSGETDIILDLLMERGIIYKPNLKSIKVT